MNCFKGFSIMNDQVFLLYFAYLYLEMEILVLKIIIWDKMSDELFENTLTVET